MNDGSEKDMSERVSRQDGTYAPSTATQTQNPELLHWRANVLLDEMMLGAIDIAAGDSVPARALSASTQAVQDGQSEHGKSRTSSALSDSHVSFGGTYPATNGHRTDDAALHTVGQDAAVQSNTSVQDNISEATWNRADRDSSTNAPSSASSQNNGHTTNSSHSQTSSHSQANEQQHSGHGTEQWLFAAEQRYQQIAARQQASRRAVAASEYDGWSMAADVEAVPSYGQNEFTSYVESASVANGIGVEGPTQKGERPFSSPGKNTTSGNTAQPSIAKNGRRKSLRSNLLPRMNAHDSHSIQQEMSLLQNGIDTTLPAGHETRTRAQRLLQKAYEIFQTDPTRSAEMDYYLQQVRTIVQRAQETAQWSNLYRSRLRTYLLGWLALSLIVILGRYLFSGPMANWAAWFVSSEPNSLLVYNLLTSTAAFFFGALGAAGSVLWTMVRQVNNRFVDRKYGLRGLILPLSGAIGGLLLCLVSGLFYALVGIDPALSIWFGLLPALMAFVLGASQEYFFSTRL